MKNHEKKMKAKVYAKLNLTLNVGGKAGDFHAIESIVTSVDLFDTVQVVLRNDGVVTVGGVEGVEQAANTAYKAAVEFGKHVKFGGADIFLDKHIPFGGGLGGSSADAAAVLCCLQQFYGADEQIVRQIAASVGSDVYYMTKGGYAVMRGKGEDVTAFDAPRVYFALTVFDHANNTGEVYAEFDRLKQSCLSDTAFVVELLKSGQTKSAVTLFSNGLQKAARSMSDYAEDYICFAKSQGLNPVMTGSGSAYFAAFDNVSDAAKACNILCNAGFDTKLCSSVPCGIEFID